MYVELCLFWLVLLIYFYIYMYFFFLLKHVSFWKQFFFLSFLSGVSICQLAILDL